MRRAAILLRVSKNTVAARLPCLGKQAQAEHERWLASCTGIEHVQVDDLITLEHTKCKPLSVCVAVCAQDRFILGVGVARIPASGPLAAVSRAKYGARPDESRLMRRELFGTLSGSVAQQALFETDGLQQYSTLIQQFFPQATHQIHPSIRGCVTGQGELKKARFDPLFSVNHTLAMQGIGSVWMPSHPFGTNRCMSDMTD